MAPMDEQNGNGNGRIAAALTQRDIENLEKALARLEAKLDSALKTQQELCEAKAATEVRLDNLEAQSRSWGVFNTIAAAIAAAIGVFVPRP